MRWAGSIAAGRAARTRAWSPLCRDMSQREFSYAVEANLTAFHVFLSEWPAIAIHRSGDRIWTVSQRRFSLCNVVLEARFEPGETDGSIDRALAPYREANVN